MDQNKTLKQRMEKKSDQLITSIEIDRELHKKMKVKLKKDGFTFHQLVEAAVKQYLDEK